jgi:hypothetical protein
LAAFFWCLHLLAPYATGLANNYKGKRIMQKTAVTRATYFGFYFYFSRGAPVVC